MIVVEATGRCTRRAFRGERGQRARKALSGTWETRQRVSAGSQPWAGMHNRSLGAGRESDRLIVVLTRVTTAERRSLSLSMFLAEEASSD